MICGAAASVFEVDFDEGLGLGITLDFEEAAAIGALELGGLGIVFEGGCATGALERFGRGHRDIKAQRGGVRSGYRFLRLTASPPPPL